MSDHEDVEVVGELIVELLLFLMRRQPRAAPKLEALALISMGAGVLRELDNGVELYDEYVKTMRKAVDG